MKTFRFKSDLNTHSCKDCFIYIKNKYDKEPLHAEQKLALRIDDLLVSFSFSWLVQDRLELVYGC